MKYHLVKKCSKCGQEKTLDNFIRQKDCKDGIRPNCKQCISSKKKEWYGNNKDHVKKRNRKWVENNLDRHNKSTKNWAEENPEKTKEIKKKWRQENKEKCNEYQREWRKTNQDWYRERTRNYENARYWNDEEYRLRCSIRNLVTRTMRALGKEKGSPARHILGYNERQLKDRLEMNFQPGMSWDNYGKWHIDHRLSVDYLMKKGERRPHIINALSNLKPMWAEENWSKNNKTELDFQSRNFSVVSS